MTDILKNYEQQFGIICADITSKISKYMTLSETDNTSEAKSNEITSNIESLFQEAREIIEQMELEVRDMNAKQTSSNEQKQKHLNIIKSYKTELNKLEAEFKRRLQDRDAFKSRTELFLYEENENNDSNGFLQKQKTRDKLVKMDRNLDTGYHAVLESEEIGKNILNDLNSQREVVQRARDRLREANTDLGRSSRVLSAMKRRLMQNKILLFGLFLFMFVFVVFSLYLLLKKYF